MELSELKTTIFCDKKNLTKFFNILGVRGKPSEVCLDCGLLVRNYIVIIGLCTDFRLVLELISSFCPSGGKIRKPPCVGGLKCIALASYLLFIISRADNCIGEILFGKLGVIFK